MISLRSNQSPWERFANAAGSSPSRQTPAPGAVAAPRQPTAMTQQQLAPQGNPFEPFGGAAAMGDPFGGAAPGPFSAGPGRRPQDAGSAVPVQPDNPNARGQSWLKYKADPTAGSPSGSGEGAGYAAQSMPPSPEPQATTPTAGPPAEPQQWQTMSQRRMAAKQGLLQRRYRFGWWRDDNGTLRPPDYDPTDPDGSEEGGALPEPRGGYVTADQVDKGEPFVTSTPPTDPFGWGDEASAGFGDPFAFYDNSPLGIAALGRYGLGGQVDYQSLLRQVMSQGGAL